MTIKKLLGRGGFCKVKEADVKVWRPGPEDEDGNPEKIWGIQQMAVKIFNRSSLRSQKATIIDPVTGLMKMSDQLATIFSEIEIWERVAHVNIVKIFELYDDSKVQDMYLVMERAMFGQIQNTNEGKNQDKIAIHNQEILEVATKLGKLTWPKHTVSDLEFAAKWIFYQVAVAMRYLHEELGFAHRDLKHENILMGLKSPDPNCDDERQETIKVCDFTTAMKIPEDAGPDFTIQSQAGTLHFNAPEQFTEGSFRPKQLDVWAFGMTLFVYMTGDFPFDKTEADIENAILSCDYRAKIDALECSDDLKNLLHSILAYDPAKRPSADVEDGKYIPACFDPTLRPSFDQILEHGWFKGRERKMPHEDPDEDKKEEEK